MDFSVKGKLTIADLLEAKRFLDESFPPVQIEFRTGDEPLVAFEKLFPGIPRFEDKRHDSKSTLFGFEVRKCPGVPKDEIWVMRDGRVTDRFKI